MAMNLEGFAQHLGRHPHLEILMKLDLLILLAHFEGMTLLEGSYVEGRVAFLGFHAVAQVGDLAILGGKRFLVLAAVLEKCRLEFNLLALFEILKPRIQPRHLRFLGSYVLLHADFTLFEFLFLPQFLKFEIGFELTSHLLYSAANLLLIGCGPHL